MPSTKIRHVQIQTVSWCNRSCSFCPSGKFPTDREFMPLETYERVLDELVRTGFEGRLSPYCMNEPLLDRRLPELVARARAKLPTTRILLQTNGDALKPELGIRLMDAGVNRLIVNVYDKSNLSRFRYLANEISAARDGVLSVGYLGRGRLSPRSRQVQVRDCTIYGTDNLTNRAGNTDGTVLAEPLKAGCKRPFNQLYVRHDGDVVLCSCDWKAEVVFGNLVEQSLEEVWHSPVAQAYRRKLAKKDRNMKLCEGCDYGGSPVKDFRATLKIRQTISDVTAAMGIGPGAPAPGSDRQLPVLPERKVARIRSTPAGAGASEPS